MSITIQELPSYEVASFRHVGSYADTHQAWDQLMQWVSSRGFFPPQHALIGISLDNPQTVEASSCRYDACVTLPAGFDKAAHPDVQFKTLPGGLYALYRFYDTADKLAVAYQTLYEQWLPASEYEADDRECLEFSMNNPAEDPEGKCKVDLYIPIRKS